MGWLAKSAASVVLRTRERKDSEDGCRLPQTCQSTSSNRQTASPTASSTSAPLLLPLLALASVPVTALPLVEFLNPLSSQSENLTTLHRINPSNEVFLTLDVHSRLKGSSQRSSQKGEPNSKTFTTQFCQVVPSVLVHLSSVFSRPLSCSSSPWKSHHLQVRCGRFQNEKTRR